LPATILVADDTALFRALISDALGEKGFEVVTAADGEQALAILQESSSQLDLAVLDLEMPGRTGEEVLEQLHADAEAPRVPVLMLTGIEFDPDRVRRLRELGASGYISKSSSVDEILERVQSVLQPGSGEAPAASPQAEVYALVEYRDDEQTWNGISHTLSATHLFVRTIQGQPVGTRLRLSFELPGSGARIEAEGIVEECVAYQPGRIPEGGVPGLNIRWLQMDPTSRRALESFLAARN
jgi:DNA-binding response OmpR family regulator